MMKQMIACVALVAFTAGCGAANAEPAPPVAKPTVVLVHGAFTDSSSWNGVVRILRGEGYHVVAAANPLRGLKSDAEYVRSVLDSVPGPVVLAGHSYGGTVMSEAADGQPSVKALVYVASFMLEAGESTSQLVAKFPGAELGSALESVPFPLAGGGTAEDLYIRQDQFQKVYAADVADDVAALMAATQRPVAASALETAATKAAWKSIPSWNLVATEDLAVPAESQRFMGARANAYTVEVNASHAVTVSQPEAVANLISEAAVATTP